MSFIPNSQTSDSYKLFSFLLYKKVLSNKKGVIPIPILVILTIVALCGAGAIGFLLGKGYSFSIGIAIGIGLVIILPNLDRIIRWSKSVKGEIRKNE